jgi:hypothetical protein
MDGAYVQHVYDKSSMHSELERERHRLLDQSMVGRLMLKCLLKK